MKIKIKRLNPDIPIPKKESGGAVCMDVHVSQIITQHNSSVTVLLGFATEIEKGYKGCIVPRSSFTQKGWIMQNSPAQIDSDYRGEWMIKFQAIPHHLSDELIDAIKEDKTFPYIDDELIYPKFPYKVGDRCAQIYFEKEENCEFEEVLELSNTVRGEGGFGSTN